MAVNIGPKIGIDGEAEYRRTINNIIQQSKTLSSEMEAVAASFDESTSMQEKNRKTAEVLAKQIDTQKERVKLLSDMLDKSSQELGENDTKTLKWKQAVNEATAQLTRMEKQLEQATNETEDFGNEADKASKQVDDLGDEANTASGHMEGLANSLKTGVTAGAKAAATAIAAASAAVVALGTVGLDYNKQMESYTTNFDVMLGDTAAAAEKVEELKEMGAKTPFEMADLASATQTLLAFNVSSSDTGDILTQLGDISLGNVQKLESLTRAYGKMNASQKVSLEDINMMIDAGFNPLLLVAAETGEAMTDVYKRISDGGVAFSEIQDAIKKATAEGGQFYKGMEKASKTTDGLISTLEDNAKALVGEVFKPVSDGLRDDVLPAAIGAVEDLSKAFQEDGIEGMIDAGSEMLGELVSELAKGGPKLVKSGTSLLKSLVKGFDKNIDDIAVAAGDMAEEIVGGLTDAAPQVIKAGSKLFSGLVKAIPDVAVDVVKSMPQIIGAICEGLLDGAEAVALAIAELFSPDTWVLSGLRDQLDEAILAVTPFADAIEEARGNVGDLGGILSEKGRTISEISTLIAETESKITEIIAQEFKDQDGYRSKDLEAIRKYNDELAALQEEKLGIYRSQQLAELRKVQLSSDAIDEETAAQRIANAKDLKEQADSVVEEMYTQELTRAENYYRSIDGLESDEYHAALKAARTHYDSMLAENKAYYNHTVEAVSKQAIRVSGIDTSKIKTSIEEAEKILEEYQETVTKNAEAAATTTSDAAFFAALGTQTVLADIAKDYLEMLMGMDTDTVNTFLSILATTKASGGDIGEENALIVANILSLYDSLPPEIEQDGAEMIRAMVSGLEAEIPGLENASQMTAEEILNTVSDYLIGDDNKMLSLGKESVSELARGVNEGAGILNGAYLSLLDDVAKEFEVPSSIVSYLSVPRSTQIEPAALSGKNVNNQNSFMFQINQQPGESAEELAYRVRDILQSEVESKEAVFGG